MVNCLLNESFLLNSIIQFRLQRYNFLFIYASARGLFFEKSTFFYIIFPKNTLQIVYLLDGTCVCQKICVPLHAKLDEYGLF